MEMTSDEIAQAVLARCENGAMQTDAAKAIAEEVGYTWRTVMNIYVTRIPREQRPIQGRNSAQRKAEMARRARKDLQQVTTRCATCRRVIHEGPLGEGRRVFAEHRAECSALAAA
jgi:hypothetical protein